MLKIELGKKRSASEAKAIVDQLYALVRERWEVKVNQTPFMQQLMAGKLPLKVLQTFFRNWGAYTIEINTLTACTYHRNITFFKVNRDLMGPIGEKIADEFIHPKPPGHFLVMLQTAQAFGLTEEEVFTTPMLSEFRGKIDFMRSIVYEGTAAEWYAAVTTEEQIGHWSAACYKALTSSLRLRPRESDLLRDPRGGRPWRARRGRHGPRELQSHGVAALAGNGHGR